jgi:hypothetical protein
MSIADLWNCLKQHSLETTSLRKMMGRAELYPTRSSIKTMIRDADRFHCFQRLEANFGLWRTAAG